MDKKVVGLLVSMVAGVALTNSACAGGCFTVMEPLRIDPPVKCLALHSGSDANDDIACGTPDVGGTNECSEPLIFPKTTENGSPRTFAPGEKVLWTFPDQSVAPDIVVAGNNDRRVYTAVATLGNQRVTLTLPTHPD